MERRAASVACSVPTRPWGRAWGLPLAVRSEATPGHLAMGVHGSSREVLTKQIPGEQRDLDGVHHAVCCAIASEDGEEGEVCWIAATGEVCGGPALGLWVCLDDAPEAGRDSAAGLWRLPQPVVGAI